MQQLTGFMFWRIYPSDSRMLTAQQFIPSLLTFLQLVAWNAWEECVSYQIPTCTLKIIYRCNFNHKTKSNETHSCLNLGFQYRVLKLDIAQYVSINSRNLKQTVRSELAVITTYKTDLSVCIWRSGINFVLDLFICQSFLDHPFY